MVECRIYRQMLSHTRPYRLICKHKCRILILIKSAKINRWFLTRLSRNHARIKDPNLKWRLLHKLDSGRFSSSFSEIEQFKFRTIQISNNSNFRTIQIFRKLEIFLSVRSENHSKVTTVPSSNNRYRSATVIWYKHGSSCRSQSWRRIEIHFTENFNELPIL